MKFIYFFILVLILFIFIFALINLIVKYLNNSVLIKTDIEKGQLSTLERKSIMDRLIELKNNIENYFDKNLIRIEDANIKIKQNEFNFIIDVRTTNEWLKGHYPIATHVPLEPQSDFKKKIGYYNRKLTFLVYCQTGRRAKIAADIMKKMGFENVKYLLGNYNRLDLPTNT
mgnify:CR=1 FL=1|jgi:rhodanese-related sulfurtransferase